MKMKNLLLALGLASATMANATTYNRDDLVVWTAAHEEESYLPVFKRTGNFTDYFFFSLSAPASATGSILVIPSANYSFASIDTWLYKDLGSAGVDSADSPIFFESGNVDRSGVLLAGSYYVKITGETNGSLGGKYAASLAAVPVPEPETYAMMIAGLGLIGGIARRRSQK